MLSKENIIQTQQQITALFNELKEMNPDWYASLRVPAQELEKRLKQFLKGIE